MSKPTIHPVDKTRWPDLVRLFADNGACAGCWCMWFRQSAKEFADNAWAKNKKAMKSLIQGGVRPGLLAYIDGEPQGWVSVGPREDFPRLNRSRVTKPVDEEEVWSIVCLFINRKARRAGLSGHLINAAVDYAAKQGARIVEGYPIDHSVKTPTNSEAFVGTVSMFEKAGFKEVARRADARPLMRKRL
jgi:GNAT superfamily N-acetyltransferase